MATTQKVHRVLKDAGVKVGSTGTSGQIRGIRHYEEGFLGELGGTVQYRCRSCQRVGSHGPTCRTPRSAARYWKEEKLRDGSVVLIYHLRTTGIVRDGFEDRRQDAMLRGAEALRQAGFEVEAQGTDCLVVR